MRSVLNSGRVACRPSPGTSAGMNEELDLGRAFSVSIAQEAYLVHRVLLPGNVGATLYVWELFVAYGGVSLLFSSQAYRLLLCLPFLLLKGADQLQSISLFQGSLLPL